MAIEHQNKKQDSAKIISVVLTVVVAAALVVGVVYALKGSALAPQEFSGVQPESEATMSFAEAIDIAQNSECFEKGNLVLDSAFYNGFSKTWWIDLEMDKPDCAPACVVSEETKTAEVNWRCTGLIPE